MVVASPLDLVVANTLVKDSGTVVIGLPVESVVVKVIGAVRENGSEEVVGFEMRALEAVLGGGRAEKVVEAAPLAIILVLVMMAVVVDGFPLPVDVGGLALVDNGGEEADGSLAAED